MFDWRYRDQQVSKISLDSKGVQNLRTENIGHATIRGADLDIEHAVAAASAVTANVQYLHAVYDSYVFDTRGQARPVSGCDVSAITGGFHVDCSGRRSPYAPEWTAAVGARQGFTFSNGLALAVNGRARYQSGTMAGLDFLPQQQQPGYWTVDAGLTIGPRSDRLSVSLFGQNLTDQTIVSNTFVVPLTTFVVGTLRAPRTVGMRVTWRAQGRTS